MTTENGMVADGYAELLAELKERIRTAQTRAALAVNSELVWLYWSIGRDILARQEAQGWGARVVERLAEDLRRVPRDEGVLAPESQVHAGFRGGVAGGGICATGCCTIAVGP